MTSAAPTPQLNADVPRTAPQVVDAFTVTPLDLLAGGGLVLVALVGWASLALAHLGRHSLPAVVLLSAVGLAVLAFVLLKTGRPKLRWDTSGLLVGLGCAATAAVLTFPGFSYGVSDKDPGVYVSHAVSISRTGSYSFIDPLLATAAKDPSFPVQVSSPGARLPGIWVRDNSTGLIVPQFYHLWPALLATSYDAFGRSGLTDTAPVVGVLSVLLVCALLQRVGTALAGHRAGLVAAGTGGLLLATNMLQVWQSKFPSTEILAQALYVGALLGLIVAVQTRWRAAAGLAGLLTGISWLNRADAVLLVLLSVGIGASLLATRRWNSLATWFAAGVLVVLPHAILQAYDLAGRYTKFNNIPALHSLVALSVGCFLAALVLRVLAGRPLGWATDQLRQRKVQTGLGLVVVVGAGLLLALGFLRPRLFGADYLDYNGRHLRSYDEQILRRLSWFFTVPGFGLVLVGLAFVALRRWSASVWTVLLPALLLVPIYLYSARNSSRLLWWSRRYIPIVLPSLVLLMALAITLMCIVRIRGRALLRIPGALALVALVGVFLSQSWPLRAHDEFGGSFALTDKIAAVSQGDQDPLYLWELQGDCCSAEALFAASVWLQKGISTTLLPVVPTAATEPASAAMIARYTRQFPGRSLYLLSSGPALPAGIEAATVTQVASLTSALPMWDESDDVRPAKAHRVTVSIVMWKVR